VSAGFAAREAAFLPVSIFAENDPVVIGRPLRDVSGGVSEYGDDTVTVWNVNGLGRPAALSATWGRINFGSLEGEWLRTAKDLAMVLFTPDHPKLLGRTVSNVLSPAEPSSVVNHIRPLILYFELARSQGFPASLRDWGPVHFAEAIAQLEQEGHVSEQKIRYLVRSPRVLYALRDVILGAPVEDPWPSAALSPIAGRFARSGELATQPVDPDTYFSMLNAALAYVNVFSEDIIQGMANLEASAARLKLRGREWRVEDAINTFFNDATRPVPMRTLPGFGASDDDWKYAINWTELERHISDNDRQGAFISTRPLGVERRARVIRKAQAGHTVIGGVVVPQARLDGREEPWSQGLDRTQLGNERRMLREACYLVIASLTMMRDSEIQEIRKGSITIYQGSPAIKSPLLKHQKTRPFVYWWITEPVKRAIQVLEQISPHPTHIFSTSRVSKHARLGTEDMGGFFSSGGIRRFRTNINSTADRTGLAPISDQPLTAHMLRRTMALITEWERGGQVAAMHQLKHSHVTERANALTGQYTAGSERWAEELQQRRAESDAQRALDNLALTSTNLPIGPGAGRFDGALRAPAAVLDDRARARLLRQSFPALRLGTANLCLGDPSVAECLTKQERDSGYEVRPTLCVPSRCANSVVLPIHHQLWRAEEQILQSLQETPKLSKHGRAMIQARLDDVVRITKALK